MQYNFDKIIDRSSSDAIKVDFMKGIWGRTDLIPLWVADMDFETAPFVTEAIRKRCDNGVFGYTCKSDAYYSAIISWVKDRYGMHVEKDMINFIPGIVPGIGMAMNALTNKGDKVMIQPPVYHPFRIVTENNGREVVYNPLQFIDGHYRMDFDALKRDIKGCSLFILCNPHNPGGTVWSREDLETLAEICYDEGVLVFSDEIHADLTFPPLKHTPFAMIGDKAKMNSVTFMSPSKAFNMPGLSASHVIIYYENIRSRFKKFIDACELWLKLSNSGNHLELSNISTNAFYRVSLTNKAGVKVVKTFRVEVAEIDPNMITDTDTLPTTYLAVPKGSKVKLFA